jgi:hypothetical protein
MEDLSYYDIDVPGSISFTYAPSKEFTTAFGLRVNPQGDIPVMPFAGLRWQFADRWIFQMMGGGPRLEYLVMTPDSGLDSDSSLQKVLSVYVGLYMEGGTFRVARNFGRQHGIAKLDNVWLSYREMRVGPGLSYAIRTLTGVSLKLDIQAGYMFYRVLNYEDEEKLDSESGAAYAGIGLMARF